MKPVIGIVADAIQEPENDRTGGRVWLNWNYVQAVADAGGTPLMIPPQSDAADILPLIDGLLVPGGKDIDASAWGEPNHPEVEPIERKRFEAEQRLFEAADPELPIFGICYGCQLINVIRGGSLIQHLPDQQGAGEHRDGVRQEYQVSGGHLQEAVKATQVAGESWHHQAIRELGSSLKVTAKSDDGTIEAVEATDRPWLVGVQWHPERSLNDPGNKELFAAFVSAAARYHERKNTVGVWT